MKKNKLIHVLLVIVLAVTLTACKEPGRYYNDEEGFSIVFPDDWQTQEGGSFMGVHVATMSPLEGADDEFRENVLVLTENISGEMTLNEYYGFVLEGLGTLENFEILEEADTTIDNRPAKLIVYAQTSSGLAINVYMHILLANSKGYIVSGTAYPDTLENYRDKFKQITETFKIE